MKLLVVGREGQLARSLAERAATDASLELIALGRPDLDLAEPGSATAAVNRVEPDVVINAAAYTAVDKAEEEQGPAFRINGEAVGELAAACRHVGARLIQLSTDYVFDGSKSSLYVETDPTQPASAYGRSKLAGEEQARAGTPDHLIVRTAWVYSPFGRNFVRTMIEAAASRDVLTVVSDQHGNPTSAQDLADALLTVVRTWRSGADLGLGQVYHLAGSGEASWYDFAQAIMEECRRIGLPAAEVKAIATQDWPTLAPRPKNSRLDCAKFARDFGFTLPDWRQSLGPVVERLAAR